MCNKCVIIGSIVKINLFKYKRFKGVAAKVLGRDTKEYQIALFLVSCH